MIRLLLAFLVGVGVGVMILPLLAHLHGPQSPISPEVYRDPA